MKSITYPQMKKIYALAKEREMDSDTLHELVEVVTGSDSIKALSSQQAVNVIDRLTGGKATGGAGSTARQRNLIEQLAKEIGMDSDPRRLRRFLEKLHGVSHPKYLTQRQASQTIEALKSMKRRGDKS